MVAEGSIIFENLCVWLDTTRAGSKMDIVDTHSPRLGRDENFLQTSDTGEESSEENEIAEKCSL